MGKRSDIEYIHKVKGISYKEARSLYHKNGDDLYKALSLNIDLSYLDNIDLSSLAECLSEAINHIAEATFKVGEAIAEIVNSIDWDKVARAYNEAKRELEDNSIEIPDNYFNEEENRE